MKPSRYSLLIMAAALYVSGVGSISTAGTTSPQMSGAVTSVQYSEKITTYVYDEGGNLIYIGMGGPEDMVLEYADPNRLVKIFRPLSMGDPNIVSLDYDIFGRLFSVRRHNQEIDERIEDRLGYDGRGNLIEVQSIYEDPNSFVEGASAVGRGLVPLGGPEKIIYEKTETTVDGAKLRIGDITYHEYDDEGRISRKIEGYSGDATLYQYDPFDPNRLASIIEPEGPILYHYDANGRLECSDYSDDNFDYCVQYRESDIADNKIVTLLSNTLSSDPNYTGLGRLELHYDSDDMLREIHYTAKEIDLATPSLCSIRYEYDSLNRLTRVHCTSASEPNLTVTIDPNIPEGGAYMVTQYEYDSLGRRIYTLTTCGHVARTLYHDMLSLSQAPRAMLEVDVVNPDLHAPPKLMSYEYDSEGRLLRCSDLMGHYVIFSPLGGGGQYLAGLGGGGQYVYTLGGGGQYSVPLLPLGGGGQYFFTLGGGGQYGLLGGGGIGKMLGMFGFDEYGNPEILIEEEEVADELEALKKKAKKKISLKAAKKKTAPVGCKEIVEGDLTGDCKADLHDLAVVAGSWLQDQSP